MRKVIWLDKAVDDVVRLREFIAPYNKEAARCAAMAIMDAATVLQKHPKIAHPIEDLPDFHDLIIPFGAGNYVLRYRMEGDVVYIVGVRHNKEAPPDQ